MINLPPAGKPFIDNYLRKRYVVFRGWKRYRPRKTESHERLKMIRLDEVRGVIVAENSASFIEESEGEISKSRRQYRRIVSVQWVFMIAVALAGALTALSGTTEGQSTFISQPGAVIIWGLVATLGATVSTRAES